MSSSPCSDHQQALETHRTRLVTPFLANKTVFNGPSVIDIFVKRSCWNIEFFSFRDRLCCYQQTNNWNLAPTTESELWPGAALREWWSHSNPLHCTNKRSACLCTSSLTFLTSWKLFGQTQIASVKALTIHQKRATFRVSEAVSETHALTCSVNTTPQMTCFLGAKVRTKWLQVKVTINENSLTTSWNWHQDEIGTKSGKSRIGHECVVTMHDADTNDNMFTIVHDCVVTLHDAHTNDNMTTSTDFHIV